MCIINTLIKKHLNKRRIKAIMKQIERNEQERLDEETRYNTKESAKRPLITDTEYEKFEIKVDNEVTSEGEVTWGIEGDAEYPGNYLCRFPRDLNEVRCSSR